MDDNFDENNESEMVLSHEYLARSRKMAANSIFEGAEEDGFGVTLHIFFGWISKSNYVLDLGAYANDLGNPDVLIYTGQGGNVKNTDKELEDQKLKQGNLALKNSSEEKNSIRLIHDSESMDGKCRIYVYDGLYVVESYRPDVGPHGKLVFKFCLRRIPGQPELAMREVKKYKKFKTREGVCVDDIS
ncbi:hypothetical protein JHK85_044067 [Glycine max]|nr:hypothetical protein JHK85_044067 [Glycine max]